MGIRQWRQPQIQQPVRRPAKASASRAIRICSALMLLAGFASSQARANDLINVEYSLLGNDRAAMTLFFSQPAPEPQNFSTTLPPRLTLDFANVSPALPQRSYRFIKGPVNSLSAAQVNGKARVVMGLNSNVPYSIERKQDRLYVLFNPGKSAIRPARPPVASTRPASNANRPSSISSSISSSTTSATRRAAPTPKAAQPAARVVQKTPARTPPRNASSNSQQRQLQAFDFRRGADGQARVVLKLNNAQVRSKLRKQGTKLILELPNTQVPKRLAQRYDVMDFGTPVRAVDVLNRGENAVVEITPINHKYEELSYQTDGNLVVELKPLTQKQVEEKFPYSGKKINLNFQDVEIRTLLEVLAEVADINLVVSDTVKGSITMRLNNVPWDQALDIVLRTKGLDKRQAGNLLYVAPLEEIATREQREREAAIASQELAPLQTELIQVNYATAAEMAALISGGDGSLLSSRGNVAIDERTNNLIVRDTADQLEDIRELIDVLDIPVRQVLIESRVVIANSNFSNEIGVRLGTTFVDSNNDGLIGVSGSSSGTDAIVQDFLDTGLPVALPNANQRYNVNLPVAGSAGQIGLALLGSNFLLDLELSALQAEGSGEVISNPRVITADQREAVILQGTEVPFLNNTGDAGATVTFKNVNLELRVRPQITPDDSIVMDLQVNKDNIGALVQSAAGPIPSLSRRSVETQVLVNNGETVVLGGIYETTRNDTETKVPFLGDVPLIGGLFRNRSKRNDKAELLIFVTPKIIDESFDVE